MNNILLFLLLNCSAVDIENVSGYNWNSHDQEVLEYCQVRCGQIYSDALCLKWFKKYGFQDYSVLCGKEK